MGKTTRKHKSGKLRKTKKNGGGMLYAPIAVRNVQYIKTLENRLVNKWNDYDWVQARRTKNWMPTKPKSDYSENNYTGDAVDGKKGKGTSAKSGWSLW